MLPSESCDEEASNSTEYAPLSPGETEKLAMGALFGSAIVAIERMTKKNTVPPANVFRLTPITSL